MLAIARQMYRLRLGDLVETTSIKVLLLLSYDRRSIAFRLTFNDVARLSLEHCA